MYQMMDLSNLKRHGNAQTIAGLNALLERGWLAHRPWPFQQELLSFALPKSFRAGETLYHQGDRANGLYAVLSGAVMVTTPADDGQEFVAHREEVGFWIGDLAMLSDERRLVTVVASRDTEVLFVPANRVQAMVERDPRNYRHFYALSHENMRTALRILANLGVTGAERRLVLRLLHLDDAIGSSGDWISVPQNDLAAMVAVSTPTLQRILKRLAADHLIELGYGRVRILDKELLLKFCQS